MSALFTQCLDDTVQTGTGKVDPARKFKFPTAARESAVCPVQNFKLCLSVRLYPINVKTAGLIGPNICVGPHMTPGRVSEITILEKNP